MGVFQILQHLLLFAAQFLGLMANGLDLFALFDDLVRKRQRVTRQFFVGGEQLALLLLKKPFGRQAGAAFTGKFLGKTHAHAPGSAAGQAARSGTFLGSFG